MNAWACSSDIEQRRNVLVWETYGKFDCEDREEAGAAAATCAPRPSLVVAPLLALVEASGS